MIFRILKTIAVFAMGFALGKCVECAMWELAIRQARADRDRAMRWNAAGGRPRKSETPEMAGAGREGAA